MKKKDSGIPIAVALVLLLVLGAFAAYLYTSFNRGVAVGEYDGQQDSFEVDWGNTTNVTEVKSLFPVEVRVTNTLANGSMYVRCRIVPRNTTWLPSNLSREASLDFLPTGGTCLNDANGQTARVDLGTGESVLVPFTLVTPTTPDLWGVSCMTIERCWRNSTPEGSDMRSDHKAFLVNITPRGTLNLTQVNASYLCSLDQDCEAYNLFGPQRCLSGRCVDSIDLNPWNPPPDPWGPVPEPTWADRLKAWARQHQTAISVGGIVVLLGIGLVLLWRKKK